MEDKNVLELKQANHFMRWVTRKSFKLLERPEVECPSRQGGHPDFRFGDNAGNECVLEITRLLNKKLKNLEKFIEGNIAMNVEGQLSGTYTLTIPVDEIGRGWMNPEVAKKTATEILSLAQSGALCESQHLSTGFVISRVLEHGARLVPWLSAPSLPAKLALNDPRARELEKEFRKILESTDNKCEGYAGLRILLIGLSQSGLYWQFHAQRFKGSQGIMITWAENEGRTLVNLDYIYLEPGISVWQADQRKVFAGHRYTDAQAGHYILLWQRPGTPILTR